MLLTVSNSGNEIVEDNMGEDVARKERKRMCTDFWWESLPRERPLENHKCIWEENVKISLPPITKMGRCRLNLLASKQR